MTVSNNKHVGISYNLFYRVILKPYIPILWCVTICYCNHFMYMWHFSVVDGNGYEPPEDSAIAAKHVGSINAIKIYVILKCILLEN